MLKSIILISLLLCLLLFTVSNAYAMTTTQKALILNANKSDIFNQLEEFTIVSGYLIQYSDPSRGLMQIFVRETTEDGNVVASKGSFYYSPPKTTKWYFSVKINQQNNNVIVLGNSSGGLMPGRYFKKFVQYMQTKGYTVYTADKDIKSASSCSSSPQPSPVQTSSPVPIPTQNYNYPPGYPPQPQYPNYNYNVPQPAIIGVLKNFSNNPTDPAYRFNYNF